MNLFNLYRHSGWIAFLAILGTWVSVSSVRAAPPTGTVTITGTATQNQTLTTANTLADADGLGAITYQWNRESLPEYKWALQTNAQDSGNHANHGSLQGNGAFSGGVFQTTTSSGSGRVEIVNEDFNMSSFPEGFSFSLDIQFDSNDFDRSDVHLWVFLMIGKQGNGSDDWNNNVTMTLYHNEFSFNMKVDGTDHRLIVDKSLIALCKTELCKVTGSIDPSGNLALYLNGSLLGTKVASSTITAKIPSRSYSKLSIGSSIDGGYPFYGSIKNFSMHNTTGLSSAPISGASGATYTLTQADVGKAITVTANYTDGSGNAEFVTSSTTTAVTVTTNAAPTFTLNGGQATASVSAYENQTLAVDVNVTDGNGDTLIYSISGGADQAKFDLNATTGILTFKNAPDYENPTDTDTNNTYVVEVNASDGTAWDLQAITVTVTDVNEAPVVVLASGAGTEADPYLIANVNNLYWLSQTSSVWSKHFLQTADINASGTSLLDSGAGIATIGGAPGFSGTYDGGGHLIDGLTINRSLTDSVGMFGQTSSAVIKNLGLKNVNVKGKKSVGGLVGRAYTSTITGCYVTGSVTSTGWMVAGIVGQSYGSTISNCYNTANVKSIGSSSNTWFQAGLVGAAYASGGINTGIKNSYSTGLIYEGNNAGNVGGLVGKDYGLVIENSFWNTATSGQATSAGGQGKSTSQMKAANLYMGWDFVLETANGADDVWEMDNGNGVLNGGYPFFSWENGNAVVYDLPTVISSVSDILTRFEHDQSITITATDSDGGNTVIAATSSDTNVATVSVAGTSTNGNETTATLTITHAGEGTAVIMVTGTNPNSPLGATQFTYTNDVTPPTTALTYTVSGTAATSVKGGDVVTITATVDEPIADSQAMRISGSGVVGVQDQNMTRVSATSYTHAWTVTPGVGGQQNWTLSSGTDLAGNEVALNPSTGGSILQDPSPVAPQGTGTESDPYLIATIDNMNWLS
ncbi:MAG: cadherin repeat domain-containing protein, partial [Opitutae bacterium]|nr:cadherin repeat domain-containing protein [Opitutae bacterium]